MRYASVTAAIVAGLIATACGSRSTTSQPAATQSLASTSQTAAVGSPGASSQPATGPSKGTEAATPAGLQSAAAIIATNNLKPDVQASYDRLSDACKKQFGVAEWGAQLILGTKMAEAFVGVTAGQLFVKSVEVRNVTGSTGEASVNTAMSKTPSWDSYVFEHGKWREASCEKVGASSSSSSGPSADVVKAWPDKWCQAQPGITKEQLYAIMGPPTSEPTDQASWSAFNYQFNAFFSVDGTVHQLDINTYQLSAAEKATLKCNETRRVP